MVYHDIHLIHGFNSSLKDYILLGTRIRELFDGMYTEFGFQAIDLGVHSFRSGGATAATQAGVTDRLQCYSR